MQNPDIAVVLLAAGASRRMGGRDKLMEPVFGEPLLRLSARAAVASRAGLVVVVLPSLVHPRMAALDGLSLKICAAPAHAEGMGSSLRYGMGALPKTCKAVIVALADMPQVAAEHYNALIEAYMADADAGIFRAAASTGQMGNPVLFDARYFNELKALRGDRGARELLASSHVIAVPTPGMGAVLDLDTPEDWLNFR